MASEGFSASSRGHYVRPLPGEVPEFAQPPDEASRKSLDDFRKELINVHRHEDSLLNSRLQGFLVASSLLAAAFSQFRDPGFVREALFLSVVGIALSATLCYVLWRTAVAVQWYIATIQKLEVILFPEKQRPYETRRRLRLTASSVPVSAILGVYVPAASLVFWIVMGVFSVTRFLSSP